MHVDDPGDRADLPCDEEQNDAEGAERERSVPAQPIEPGGGELQLRGARVGAAGWAVISRQRSGHAGLAPPFVKGSEDPLLALRERLAPPDF